MAYYRLYFLDRFSGHIDHFREFETRTDADAVAQAEIWREASAMELWCGQRKVMRWEPLASSPEARARDALRIVRPVS
jgi:hypothetical protein